MTARGIDSYVSVGFTFRELPGALRGRLVFDEAWCASLVERLRGLGAATGAVFIQTCNRNEIVLTSSHPSFAAELVRAQLLDPLGDERGRYEPFRYVGAAAVKHVLRLTSSLDSMAVGEHEIAQQVRRSFEAARAAGWLDKRLNGLSRIALETSREVHGVLRGPPTGVFTLAANAVREHVGDPKGRPVAVLGLGDIGRRTAWALAAEGYDVHLSTRTPRTVTDLGPRLAPLTLVPWEERRSLVGSCDALVVATGAPMPTLTYTQLALAKEREKPLLLVDLGIPPQIDAEAASAAGARLVDVDQLGARYRGEGRAADELRQAEELIDAGLEKMSAWLLVREHATAFARLRDVSERFREDEIGRLMQHELAGLVPAASRDVVRDRIHDFLNRYADSLYAALEDTLGVEHEEVA